MPAVSSTFRRFQHRFFPVISNLSTSATSAAHRIPNTLILAGSFGTTLSEDNPTCFCGRTSRRDNSGMDTKLKGGWFWKCARSVCGYYSGRDDGMTKEEAIGWACRLRLPPVSESRKARKARSRCRRDNKPKGSN
jgi:hypothetical protein